MNSFHAILITQFENDGFGYQNARKRVGKLQEATWLTVINKIFKFALHLVDLVLANKLFVWTLFRIPELLNSKMIDLVVSRLLERDLFSKYLARSLEFSPNELILDSVIGAK